MDPFEAIYGQPSDRSESATYFESSAELEHIAHKLLDQHLTLARLRDVRVVFLLQQGTDPASGKGREGTIDTIAKAIKTPPLYQLLAHCEAVIWVNGRAWQVLGERQREAVVLHELLHIDVDEKTGKVVLLKHDVEEFSLVVAQYGPWHGALERFGEQMGLWSARSGDGLQSLADDHGLTMTIEAGGRSATIEPRRAAKKAS